MSVLPVAARLDRRLLPRLQIHLTIRAIQIRELARQSITQQETRDLARLIDFRQRQSRQLQTCRRRAGLDVALDLVPPSQHLATELLVGPRPLHLGEHMLIVFLHRLDYAS